jgi:hypothetical protein
MLAGQCRWLIYKMYARIIPDRQYIQWKFKKRMGKRLDLRNPQTFSEKLQWLKLYWRSNLLTQCADKYAVRKFVANRVGPHILKKLYGVYDNAGDIEWDKLPNAFALKINHGCMQMILCNCKEELDRKASVQLLNSYLQRNNYYHLREWAYKNIPARIICEEHLAPQGEILYEYNFFCYNGAPQLVEIIEIDQGVGRANAYDLNLNLLWRKYKSPPIIGLLEKNRQYEEMMSYAKKLSQGFPFVRVDFVLVRGQVYFGEMTFYPLGGMYCYNPEAFDLFLGSYLQLPEQHFCPDSDGSLTGN